MSVACEGEEQTMITWPTEREIVDAINKLCEMLSEQEGHPDFVHNGDLWLRRGPDGKYHPHTRAIDWTELDT